MKSFHLHWESHLCTEAVDYCVYHTWIVRPMINQLTTNLHFIGPCFGFLTDKHKLPHLVMQTEKYFYFDVIFLIYPCITQPIISSSYLGCRGWSRWVAVRKGFLTKFIWLLYNMQRWTVALHHCFSSTILKQYKNSQS